MNKEVSVSDLMPQIEQYLDSILEKYSSPDYYQQLLQAKEIYTESTGKINDDDDEFESRMNCFNDWYVFDYCFDPGSDEKTLLQKQLKLVPTTEELSFSLLSHRHSLFEFSKINYKKQFVLHDILQNEKISIDKNQKNIGLLVGDVFTGRVLKTQESYYLLKGVCTFPHKILSILKKQCKKVRKLKNREEEKKFLLKLEFLKTKYLHYSHIDPEKIFTFQ